jgi:uncharacterized protein (TIGR02246 family)
MKIIQAHTKRHIEEVRALFREYQVFLGVDLGFQGFEEELAGLPGKYVPPDGLLLLAMSGQKAAGCGALRKLDGRRCEMKRLFVRPKFRGRGLGKTLAKRLVDEALRMGYSTMVLDTLDKLKAAMGIYESLGFVPTKAYYRNPLSGVVYWKLDMAALRRQHVSRTGRRVSALVAFPIRGSSVLARMRRYAGIAASIAALAFAGCAGENRTSKEPGMSGQSEDILAIRQLVADWRAGWLAGDADLLVSLYGDEPVVLPQDQPAVFGKDAIRTLYRSLLKEYDIKSEGKLVEVEASGDWGYFWSTYTLTATPKAGGQPIRSTGKSVFIVRRGPGGAWKIARLIDNSDGATTDQEAP